MRILLICIAVLPPILILIYFYKRDKYKPEPKKLITFLFIISGITVFPASQIELYLGNILLPIAETNIILLNIIKSFGISAIIEESIKLLLIWLIAYRHKHFDESVDGIIYAVTASLGFAAVENVFYCLNSGLYIAIIRAFTAIPLHCAASGIMGYYLGRAKFTKSNMARKRLFFIGWLSAVIIHGSYNFLLYSIELLEMYSIIGVFALLVFSLLKLSKSIKVLLATDFANGRHLQST